MLCSSTFLCLEHRNSRTQQHPSNQGSNQTNINQEYQPLASIMTVESMDEIQECSICISAIQVNDTIIELGCKHIFHHKCLQPWIEEHRSCPLCRENIQFSLV